VPPAADRVLLLRAGGRHELRPYNARNILGHIGDNPVRL
jgi:hypothetical protein